MSYNALYLNFVVRSQNSVQKFLGTYLGRSKVIGRTSQIQARNPFSLYSCSHLMTKALII